MGSKLYVGNLAYSTRDDDLHQFFSGFGGVVSAKVWSMPDRMYVGVRVAFGYGLDRVLEDVRRETMDLADPGEQWEFGQLDGD